MKKTATTLFIVIMILLCFAPLVLELAGLDSPSVEKKAAARVPALIVQSGSLNSRFTQELDSYISDTFPLRTWMISAWHHLNQLLWGQSGNEKVVTGDDGWLFYAETLPSFLARDNLSDAEYVRLERYIDLQKKYLADQGIGFLYTIAPNKNTVYPDQMPDRYVERIDYNALAGLKENLNLPGYVDLRDALIDAAHTEEKPLYHLTDTHWNNRGAFIAGSLILDRAAAYLGDALSIPHNLSDAVERADWPGDLALMLYPSGPSPDWQQYFSIEPGYRYTRPIKSLEDILITTKGTGDHRILMFRDSFANALIPMLSGVFAEASYSRAVPYDYALLARTDPDLVILEIVERNLLDWLTTPPRMPAIAFTESLPGASPDKSIEHLVTLEKDGSYWKMSGQITGPAITADWTRVLVNIQESWYEAFPVTDFNDPTAAGYVLYLDESGFSAEPKINATLVKCGSEWFEAGLPG